MTKGFTFLQKAEKDIEEIMRYISQDNPEVAATFHGAVESTCELLVTMPEMGSPRTFNNPELEGLRMWPMKKFEKYLIFYRSTPEGIEIVRVLHGARDIPAIFEE